MMTHRERQLAILNGKSPDKIPWVPRMDVWYQANYLTGTLPKEFRGMRLRDIERSLGLATPAMTGRVFSTRYRDIDVIQRRDGLTSTTEYVTPVGVVTVTRRRTPTLDRAGIAPLQIEHMIKRPEDIDIVMYIVENTEYFATYEEFDAYDREIGDDGLPLVVSGGQPPFNEFLCNLAGYDSAYLYLFDEPNKVERLLETMIQCYRERLWPILADSPAQLFLHGGHFDSQMTPPRFYDKYMTSHAREFTTYMHKHGKTIAHHADADSSQILDQLSDSGYDMQHCFTTAPMVPLTLKEAREKWGTSMIIFGGIPSVMLEDTVSDEEFEAYMRDLFRTIAPGDAFMLGVVDLVMPTSQISRIRRVTEMVDEYGCYPVAA